MWTKIFSLAPAILHLKAQGQCFGDECEVNARESVNGLFRADDNGVDQLFDMVRIMICQKYQNDVTLNQCTITDEQISNVLRNYGCNCLPESHDDVPIKAGLLDSWHMGKNGRPLDFLDEACTRLRDGYTCLVYDVIDDLYDDFNANSAHNQDKCGRSIKYTFHTDEDKNIICGNTNNPEYAQGKAFQECSRVACFMERQFATEVFDIIGSDPDQYILDNAAMYNVFGDNNICVKHRSNGRQSECCGDFPLRQPFHPLVKTCCNDGIARPNGDC